MVIDPSGKTVPAESVLQLREANLMNFLHADKYPSSESSDDEGDGGQIKPDKSK